MSGIRHRVKESNPVVQEYNRLAPDYDKRWAFYIEATLRETAKRLELKGDEKILDIGCGTGSLFQKILRPNSSLTLVGVDFSREMLKLARKKLALQAYFITARAQDLPFPKDTFNIVVSCNAFHYWRRPQQCLREIKRVIRPQGRVIITDWCNDYFFCRVFDFFLSIFNRAHFKTYGQNECKYLLQQAGFEVIQAQQYKINWFWGLMTLKSKKMNG